MTETEAEQLIVDSVGEDRMEELTSEMESILAVPPLPEIAEYLGLSMSELSNSPNFLALRASAIADLIFKKIENILRNYGVPEEHIGIATAFIRRHAGI